MREPDKFNSKGGRRYFNIVLEDQGKYPDQLVTEYCNNDVFATEATFHARAGQVQFKGRQKIF